LRHHVRAAKKRNYVLLFYTAQPLTPKNTPNPAQKTRNPCPISQQHTPENTTNTQFHKKFEKILKFFTTYPVQQTLTLLPPNRGARLSQSIRQTNAGSALAKTLFESIYRATMNKP
jgi:hypothetical protein